MLFRRLLPVLLLAIAAGFVSCSRGPAIRPGLQLAKGEKYSVDLDVHMSDKTKIIVADMDLGKQRFSVSYEWEVLDVVADTEYVIRSTIQKFESRQKRDENYRDRTVPVDDSTDIAVVPLDSILKKLQSISFRFTLTRGGEVTEVHGADSAIYQAFETTYGVSPDTIHSVRNDYFLVKSFCGNRAFANFIEQFFCAYRSEEGWHTGGSFNNASPMHEQVESIDEDYEFYSLNRWKCAKKEGNYELALKGDFTNRKEKKDKSDVGIDLKVSGAQSGTIQYDTLSFLPVDAVLDQEYEISSGMRNVIFSFKLTSYQVQRSLKLKITKLN